MQRLMRLIVLCAGLALGACAGSVMPPAQPPRVSLVDLQIQDVKLFEQRYGLTLRVQNPNDVALPIVGMEYRVQLNGIDFGRGVARAAVTVPAYGEAVIPVDLVSNTWDLLARVRNLEAGRLPQSLKMEITGSVSLARSDTPLPFSFAGEIGGGRRN